MQSESNTYKYLTWVFGIIALLFIILFFTKGNPEVADTVNDISAEIASCQARIAEWQSMYGTQANATTSESQNALNDILEDCNDIIQSGQDRI